MQVCATIWYQWPQEIYKGDKISAGNNRYIAHFIINNKDRNIKWYIDAKFSIHKDMRSNTRSFTTIGRVVDFDKQRKQKLNPKGLTEAKLVCVDDVLTQVSCTRYLLETEGYKIYDNIVYKYNQRYIKLDIIRRKSISKQTRHIIIRYYFITDQFDT